MFSVRKAIKQFRNDFITEPDAPSTSSLRTSDTSSSRTPSEDVSRYSAPLARSLQNTSNREELPIISIQHAERSNFNEAVSPLQKRSLIPSLQHNTSLVRPNESLPLTEGDPSRQDQSKLEGPVPVNPMNKELSRIALSNSSEKRTSSSSNSSVPSIDILPPATPSKQLPPESLQEHIFNKTLPPDPGPREYERESPLLTSPWEYSGDYYDMKLKSLVDSSVPSNGSSSQTTEFSALMTRVFRDPLESKLRVPDTVNEIGQTESMKRPKSPVEFTIPLNASSSKTTKFDAAPIARAPREVPSNSLSSSEVNDRPIESMEYSVTQTSQQLREVPYEDSVIQTTTPTAINDDNNDQIERLDPTPITQPLPLTSNKLLEKRPNPFFEREESIPGDFPLEGPPTSSSVQSPPVKSATRTLPENNRISPKDNNDDTRVEARRASLNSFLIALAAPQVPPTVEQPKTPWKPKPLRLLQPIGESSDSMSANSTSSLSADDALARKMEELGRLRRMESRNQLARPKASNELTPQRPPLPVRTTAPELRPHIQEDSSSDMTALLRTAYVERQQELQTQLDKALAELRDVRAENKRLTNENQTQHRSIVQLKISLDEAKHAQGSSSVQIKNQLRDATASLTALNKEKKGWQEKLDAMQHKLSVAERQVRSLDHLTRHKLESRQEGAYGQPKRRGLLGSVPASTDVIAAMNALNEEIFQTCVQLVECLERTTSSSNNHKPLARTVVGNHLTAMLEDQATATTSGYNMLLMQAVLEVFMVHWCSSIIEAFYPSQKSFADLLVELSAQTARTPATPAICGKQVRIVQPSTTHSDNAKFNEWVTGILRDLGLILLIAGLRMKVQRTHPFTSKTLALVKAAYNLRTAMAEKDICGGLEVVVVAPDTPFQEKWMTDSHADPRKGDTDQSHVDFVAGTSGIGLQRQVSEKVDGHFQAKMVMAVKPKVILTRTLNVKG